LAEAAARAWGVPGAEWHRYDLSRPIGRFALAAFEKRLGGRLPEEYRQWITTVADGGAGPIHGLLPLAFEPLYIEVDYSADFPFSADHPCLGAEEESPECERDTLLISQGMTVVTDEGCCRYNILVLRGPAAGQVWWYWSERAMALPIRHPETGAPVTFLDWYDLWLTRAAGDGKPIGSFEGFC